MNKTTEKPLALARNEELVIQDLPDEVLVYDLKHHKAHCLNETAAFIWKNCDGQRTAEDIAKMMEAEWRTPVTEDAVWFALNKLSKAELLQERIVLPQEKAGMSRRSAVRRLGFGALLTVPVVMSIVAPTAMAGASTPAACQTCVKKSNGIQDCPAACPTAVVGTCYSNAGCGTGQAFDCRTCQSCFSATTPTPPFDGTISWKAGGVIC